MFSVDLPAGDALSVLNGIVRAHGGMVWALDPSASADFPRAITLHLGYSGRGFGIPVGAQIRPHWPVIAPAATPENLPSARLVGPGRDGRPLVWSHMNSWDMSRLAEAAGIPMGLEELPGGSPFPMGETTLTGMTLGAALAAITAADPRYEWREMSGVIVFRSVSAWEDSNSLLFGLAGDVQLNGVTMAVALRAAVSRLSPHSGLRHPIQIVDERRVSVDLWSGTHLELWNAIARSHGATSWVFAPVHDVDERRRWRHTLAFYPFGGGVTMPIGIP